MRSTRDYFPSATITEGTADEYADEWVGLVKRFGMDRFEQGLVMARKYTLKSGVTVPREFFPKPSEIEEFIATKTLSPTYAKTDDNCTDCRGTGFKYLLIPGERKVERCHCRKLVAR